VEYGIPETRERLAVFFEINVFSLKLLINPEVILMNTRKSCPSEI